MKKLLTLCAVALVGASLVAASPFCWDNTDKLIVKLKQHKLTSEQLKDVFAYQSEHRTLMKQAHTEGLGCGLHERNEVNFEKSAIGVLTDEQFKAFKGRNRTEVESLRYENYLLKKELEALKAELEKLRTYVDVSTK